MHLSFNFVYVFQNVVKLGRQSRIYERLLNLENFTFLKLNMHEDKSLRCRLTCGGQSESVTSFIKLTI